MKFSRVTQIYCWFMQFNQIPNYLKQLPKNSHLASEPCWSHRMKNTWGLPWRLSVKNPPANAGDTGLIPDPGKPHLLGGNQAHPPQLLSLCSRTQEPQLLSLLAVTAEAWAPRARAPRQEKSLQWEACAPQLEKARRSQKEINKIIFKKRKNTWRTSLMVQWLRLRVPKAGVQVQSQVRELDATTKTQCSQINKWNNYSRGNKKEYLRYERTSASRHLLNSISEN